ncbi:hypothetical protein [Mycolicibacter minnesotensis]
MTAPQDFRPAARYGISSLIAAVLTAARFETFTATIVFISADT